jgi:hypothetical protein
VREFACTGSRACAARERPTSNHARRESPQRKWGRITVVAVAVRAVAVRAVAVRAVAVRAVAVRAVAVRAVAVSSGARRRHGKSARRLETSSVTEALEALEAAFGSLETIAAGAP